ncbi:hypothetical protein AMTRI_Chr01g107740 [Amborella trichopoda]
MGCSCLILVGKFFTEGYFPQRVLRQFRHAQNYTSPGEVIDHRPIFTLRRHSSPLWSRRVCRGRERSLLLVRGWLRKTSPRPLPTIILGGDVPALFHYALDLRDFVVNLLLLLRIPCFLERTMTLPQINESNPMRMCTPSAWKRLKSNWLDGWPS